MFKYKKTFILLAVLVALIVFSVCQRTSAAETQKAEDKSQFNLSVDLYGVQTNLMPYKGYQNDLMATVYLKYGEFPLIPFLRHVETHYYYLIETPPTNENYTSDRRLASGGGLDLKFNNYLKFRYIVESVDNKLSNTSYTQESYGLIYNQYLSFKYAEFNNYLETFLIPRVDNNSPDTFLKIQMLKSFYLSQSNHFSNVMYPFLQIKVKSNDNANFGVSGESANLGAGYRFYGVNDTKDSFAFVLEAHSVFYQSEKLNGDWLQMMAAFQLWID